MSEGSHETAAESARARAHFGTRVIITQCRRARRVQARKFGDLESVKGSDGQPIAIPFPPDEVRKVEDELLEMLRGEAEGGGGQGLTHREVHEEVVDFEDWMVDAEHPEGIEVADATALPLKDVVRAHPQLVLTKAEWDAVRRDEPALAAACADDAPAAPDAPQGRDEITSQLEQIKAQLVGLPDGDLRENLTKRRDELHSALDRLDHQLLFGGGS